MTDLIMELENTAEWRAQKAKEYPDDERNADAVAICQGLRRELLAGPQEDLQPESDIYDAVHDFLFSEGTDDGDEHEVARRWNEYRGRIGFDRFPGSAKEYLHDLIEIAFEVYPASRYLRKH